MKIQEKALSDLEFTTVLQQLSQLAITAMGKERCLELQPFENEAELILQLESVSEFTASFANENRIPNHGFDDLTAEIHLLKIENSVLEIDGFRRIAAASEIINIYLSFLKNLKNTTPSYTPKEKILKLLKNSS